MLLELNWSSTSWAWTLEGHRLIAVDALAVLPPPMREALAPHVSILLAGAVEPDFHRVVSHKIPIIGLRETPAPPRSGAADALNRLAINTQEMLRLGRGLDEVLFVQGQASHFVEDLNQPLHAAWGETRAEHNEIEAQMLYRSSQHARALFFDRDIKRVTEIAWDHAVNDTANLWQSVFWHALGPERAWQLYGIPAPVKEIGNRPLC